MTPISLRLRAFNDTMHNKRSHSLTPPWRCPGVAPRRPTNGIGDNMPKKRLTDRTLQALKPAEPGKRYTVWDTESSALGVRVTDRGHASFIVMRRRPGDINPIRFVLGTYPDLTLKEAREKADEARKDLRQGVHPKEKAEQYRREEARKRKDTFESVADEFLKRHVSKLRTAPPYRSSVAARSPAARSRFRDSRN
jgi:hypothetical protein